MALMIIEAISQSNRIESEELYWQWDESRWGNKLQQLNFASFEYFDTLALYFIEIEVLPESRLENMTVNNSNLKTKFKLYRVPQMNK